MRDSALTGWRLLDFTTRSSISYLYPCSTPSVTHPLTSTPSSTTSTPKKTTSKPTASRPTRASASNSLSDTVRSPSFSPSFPSPSHSFPPTLPLLPTFPFPPYLPLLPCPSSSFLLCTPLPAPLQPSSHQPSSPPPRPPPSPILMTHRHTHNPRLLPTLPANRHPLPHHHPTSHLRRFLHPTRSRPSCSRNGESRGGGGKRRGGESGSARQGGGGARCDTPD